MKRAVVVVATVRFRMADDGERLDRQLADMAEHQQHAEENEGPAAGAADTHVGETIRSGPSGVKVNGLVAGHRYSWMVLSRSAFAMTETELKLIAAAAIIGLRSNPKNG